MKINHDIQITDKKLRHFLNINNLPKSYIQDIITRAEEIHDDSKIKKCGTTRKANDVAVKYTLANGITLAALSANGTTALGAKAKASNVGASYALTPGVKLNAESGKLDAAN